MKPLDSAQTQVDALPDGRRRYAIVHDVLRDVTPEMLVWWFQHMDGVVEIAGRQVPRYRAWHPIDHVMLTYLRPADDGAAMGPGSRMRIVELFGGEERYRVDATEDVLRLDPGGFVHVNRRAGVEVARMEYTFERVAGGTLYRNSLVVGASAPLLRPLNALVAPLVFPDHMGRRWLQHNVEEVGNFEHFLPQLYETERRLEATSDAARETHR